MANELTIVDDRAEPCGSLVRARHDHALDFVGLPLPGRDLPTFGSADPDDLILADLDLKAAVGIAFTATASDPRITERAGGPSAL